MATISFIGWSATRGCACAFSTARKRRDPAFGARSRTSSSGAAAPSLLTLHRITEALGTTVAACFSDQDVEPLTVYRAGERPVADDNHTIGAAAFEKGMGEQNRVLDPPGRVGRNQSAPGLTESALVRSQRNHKTGLSAGAYHHHFLPQGQFVNQRPKLFPRAIEAGS